MPDDYILMLQEHIKINNLKEDNFIFFSSKNKNDPIPEQTFRKHSNDYCKKISPAFHFHQFRKSTVTHLFDKDISLEEIKNYVGHSSSNITKDVYLKRSKERNQAILDVLNATIKDIK